MKKMLLLYLSIYNFMYAKSITFIMPCFNVEDKVTVALDSIYAQNIAYPFEVICADDGSTDNTYLVLQRYARTHKNMKVLRHPANKGAGAAANTCVHASSSELLFRLDADNILPADQPELINRLTAAQDYLDCDAVAVHKLNLFMYDEQHAKKIITVWEYKAPHNICTFEHCIMDALNPAMSGNYLYTRASFDRVGGYPEDHGSDTFRFGFMQYATGGFIAVLPDSYYWHFYNPNGYWWREQKTGNNDAKALETVLQYKHRFDRVSQQQLLALRTDRKNTLFTLINARKLRKR